MSETIVSTERAFEGKLVKVDVHQVTLQDGTSAVREMVQHPGAVAIVALDADDNVLMIRQFRMGAGTTLYEIPAGTLEPGEDPAVCAARELREETGMRANKLEKIGGWYPVPGYSTEYVHLYIGTDLEDAPLEGDTDEFITLEPMPFADAVERIDRGQIINSTALIGLLLAARLRG